MRRLTDILEEMHAVTPAQVRVAATRHRQVGRPIGQCLVDIRACVEATIVKGLSVQLGVQAVSVAKYEVEPAVLRVIPREIAEWYNVLPLGIWPRPDELAALHVAMSHPNDENARQHLRQISGYPIVAMIAGDREIAAAIARCYGEKATNAQDTLATAAMNDWIDFDD